MSESLATGTYEVLRNRLRDAAADLRARFDELNAARAAAFGSIETKLGGTAHVSTDTNCIPRDLLAIGDKLLLGYNVQFGLKTEVSCEDVFSLYRLEGEIAHPEPLRTIFNEQFQRDYKELYRYYKNTQFLRFFTAGPLVYFVFQVGKSTTDIKAFKWAIEGDSLRYIDGRSDQEVRFPEQHAFGWQRATRDQHRSGLHPHISINDLVFVECVGGDLTIKVEDNTADGSGIYAEPVENVDQTLDDAEISYCLLGNLILLKIKPYLEKDFRYLVFSRKRERVTRLDAIARSCVLLPDDHGIIFPGGIFLQNGTYKLFDHGLQNLLFERTIAAPNGEDFLYLFADLESGTYLHLRYNLIRQEVDTPFVCHGQALFDDGRLTTFRGHEHPQKHHALQLWQTPFVGPNHRVEVATDSMLYKIGNRDLVRGMAECQELLRLIDTDDSYNELYMDLVKRSTDILDSYFWIDRDETMRLSEPLAKIRDTAGAAIEEFDKVVRVRLETESAVNEVQSSSDELIKATQRTAFDSVAQFVESLAALRAQRGRAIGLRERRYVDSDQVESLEKAVAEASERVGYRCVDFLLKPKSLAPYHQSIAQAEAKIASVKTAAEGRKLSQQLQDTGDQLELLIETISQLRIEDLTQRTAIVEQAGDLLADLNRVRSTLKARLRDLLSGEMEADFASQMRLLDQTMAGALETAVSPEKVDEALTRIMLQVEELEARFAEFDELVLRLSDKRESLYEAFESRRVSLVEARSRRAEGLGGAADRILQGIDTRASRITEDDALRSYFASDPMVDKLRQIAEQLKELGDTVRMNDVVSRLKALADDSMRQLHDRQELYIAGEDSIKFGRHVFSVNRQPFELTSVVRGGELQVHLTGTQFFQKISDPDLENARDLWHQILPSESEQVYRAEFLAYQLFTQSQEKSADPNSNLNFNSNAPDLLALDEDAQIEFVRSAMQHRHDEGYSRGVHDRDAARLLASLLRTDRELGILRYAPSLRGRAWFAWKQMIPAEQREWTESWIAGFRTVASVLPKTIAGAAYVRRLQNLLQRHARSFLADAPRHEDALRDSGASNAKSASTARRDSGRLAVRASASVHRAAKYLFAQIIESPAKFTASPTAVKLASRLREALPPDARKRVEDSLIKNSDRPRAAWELAIDAVGGYLRSHQSDGGDELDRPDNYLCEAAMLLLETKSSVSVGSKTQVASRIEGMLGDHRRIAKGVIPLHYHAFLDRLSHYCDHVLPRYSAYRASKQKLLRRTDSELKTADFKPKVLTSFVRNQLIDEVYLPLTGDNLAKQIGAAGDTKRSDRMGLLLLISPPGYGKTTLMEYVANRLGLVFVKVNGPAIGHAVTSLDPQEATNASAREEVKRINMGLEMGDNVMLYLDDIQHCNPELLQKFIPLCDATRRIEGVWEGESKTYDLRGRQFAVVMAGNPYTESGDRFQIPDMLANRADVYNLGEIIGDAREAFELSYIENCLTSNVTLQALARASSKDQRAVIHAAARGSIEGLNIQANISPDQLSEMMAVLVKLNRVRDIVLRVNRTYINSAAQADAYRTEPPFKLQGSYRNMNRIAERVVPLMNDAELQSLIYSNYEQDAQTLTRDGESNVLKFKELLGILTSAETERWNNIKYAYVESTRMQGIEGEDSTAQVLRTIAGLRDGLESIRRTLVQAVAADQRREDASALREGLERLSNGLLAFGQQVTGAISTSSKELKSAERELPEQKVIVQHSVPRVMTDLIRSQFQLLYDGLRPVLESSATSQAQLDKLRASIDDCLQNYKALQKEIEESPN